MVRGQTLQQCDQRFAAERPAQDQDVQDFGKITRDITKRTAAEARVRTSETSLERPIDIVLDTMMDGLITSDRTGVIQSSNNACIRMFGYAPDEVLGQNVRILMPGPDHNAHDGCVAAYLQTDAARIIGTGREVMGRRKDGTTLPMERGVGESRHRGNHAFVGLNRELTERREAETQREQLRQAQKMEAVGQLNGGAGARFQKSARDHHRQSRAAARPSPGRSAHG